MEEAAVHLVQRLLSLRETRVPGRRRAERRISGVGFRWCAVPRLRSPMVRSSAASDLVQGNQQTLVPPFPLHQVFGPFRRLAVSELVHGFPQALVPPFPLHQVFGPFRRLAVSDLVQEFPQTLVPSFPLHQVPSPDEPHPARTWCFIPRKPLFLRPEAPRPRPRMGSEKEVRTNFPFACTSFHFCSV